MVNNKIVFFFTSKKFVIHSNIWFQNFLGCVRNKKLFDRLLNWNRVFDHVRADSFGNIHTHLKQNCMKLVRGLSIRNFNLFSRWKLTASKYGIIQIQFITRIFCYKTQQDNIMFYSRYDNFFAQESNKI